MGTVPLAHVHVTTKAGRVRKCFALTFLNILQWLAASCSWRGMCFSASMRGPPEAAGAHHCEGPRSTHSCPKNLMPEKGERLVPCAGNWAGWVRLLLDCARLHLGFSFGEVCVLLCSPSSASKGSLMALTSIRDVDKQTQVTPPWWPSRVCSCMA